MRRAATALLAVVATLSLAACGGGDGRDDGGARAAALESPADTMPAASAQDGAPALGGDRGRDGDGIEFITTPPTTTTSTTTSTTTTTTTLPPTTTSTTSTTTSTTSTTTTSTTTTSSTSTTSSTTSTSTTSTTLPSSALVRCSFDADALFEPGEATLTDAAAGELTALAAQLGDDVRTVTVEGRTDHRGSDAANLALSEARAAAAAGALVDAGTDEALITVVGVGEADARQPVDGSTPSADELAADRRVDIVIDADVAPATCTTPAPP